MADNCGANAVGEDDDPKIRDTEEINNNEEPSPEDLELDLSGEQRTVMNEDIIFHPKLEALILMGNRFTKIEGINHLTCLKKLVLRQNLIAKFENIGNLKNLEELDLYDNKITVIENIDFPHLTFLDLSFNEIRQIPYIPNQNLPVIREIYLINNKISVISGLQELTTLTLLELGSNRVRKIENLETLINLEQLWLGKNKITVIQNLDNLTKLTKLSIQSNRLSHIGEGLRTLVNLEELYLSANGIEKLEGLETLVNLKTLDIASNQIKKLENLATLKNLEELWCNDNLLESWEDLDQELRHLTQLRTIYLERNPLSKHPMYKQRILHMLPQLEQLDADIVRSHR